MEYEKLLMMTKDGIKFVQNFAGIIDKSTPHLYLSALPFSPSNSILARSVIETFAGIAQVAVGQQEDWPRNQQVLHGHASAVLSVAFSPDGRHIVSGSLDKTIQFWDAQTGGQVGNPLQGHTDSVFSVAFSPDGRHIVSGSRDKTIQLWDVQTGGQVGNPLQGHTDSVFSVAFSPDGRHIVSGSRDKTIQLWDAQTGGQVGNPLQGHTWSVDSVAFSPDGRYIVSGSRDETIQLWDAQTGEQVGNPLQGHTSSVNSVAFSPDGRHIVSGSCDETIQLCNAQMAGGQVGNALKEQTSKSLSSTLSPIHFSSSAAHALHDVHSLFVDMSIVKGDFRDLVHLQNDGWIMGPKGKLLLWVPPSYHKIFHHTPWTHLVIPRGIPELDLSKMAHGPTWHKCYTPVLKAN